MTTLLTKEAETAHPVDALIAARWSPYCFDDRPVPKDDLLSIFEAARWAASSYNEQPWRYFVAIKDENPDRFERLLSCLVMQNRPWAQAAPVLALGCTRLNYSQNERPNAAAQHDLGLASATLTFEATARGLKVHQMIGIVPDRAIDLLHIPTGFIPLTALAIGYAADPHDMEGDYAERDLTPRARKPLDAFIFQDTWGQPADFTSH